MFAIQSQLQEGVVEVRHSTDAMGPLPLTHCTVAKVNIGGMEMHDVITFAELLRTEASKVRVLKLKCMPR